MSRFINICFVAIFFILAFIIGMTYSDYTYDQKHDEWVQGGKVRTNNAPYYNFQIKGEV